MGKVVLTPSWPFQANENFLRNIKSRQSNPYNMAPIKASLHRSQFSNPVLFLDYGGRDSVDMQPYDLLSTCLQQKSGKKFCYMECYAQEL